MNSLLINTTTESSAIVGAAASSFNKAVTPPYQEKKLRLHSHSYSFSSYNPLKDMLFGHNKLVDLQAIWTDLVVNQEDDHATFIGAATTAPSWTTGSFFLGKATLWGNSENILTSSNDSEKSFKTPTSNHYGFLSDSNSFLEINKASTLTTTSSSLNGDDDLQSSCKNSAIFPNLDLPKFVMDVYNGFFHDYDNVSCLEMDDIFYDQGVEETKEEEYFEKGDEERVAIEVEWLENRKFTPPFEDILIVTSDFDDAISAFDDETWASAMD